MPIQNAERTGKIGGLERGNRVGLQHLEGLIAAEFTNACADVVIAEMQDTIGNVSLLKSDARANAGTAQGELCPARNTAVIVLNLDVVTKDAALAVISIEERADGVMCTDLEEIDFGRFHPALINICAVAVFSHVAGGITELVEEALLEPVLENDLRKLQGATGVHDDLYGFKA